MRAALTFNRARSVVRPLSRRALVLAMVLGPVLGVMLALVACRDGECPMERLRRSVSERGAQPGAQPPSSLTGLELAVWVAEELVWQRPSPGAAEAPGSWHLAGLWAGRARQRAAGRPPGARPHGQRSRPLLGVAVLLHVAPKLSPPTYAFG